MLKILVMNQVVNKENIYRGRMLKKIVILGFFSLGGVGCSAITPKYVGLIDSSPEQRVTFIGEENNHTNAYTRTVITLNPYPLNKKNLNAPSIISTYPVPKRIYVSCSNFRNGTSSDLSLIEYRKTYIKDFDFKPGRFYQFKCSKADRSFSGEYQVDMKELKELPEIKGKW